MLPTVAARLLAVALGLAAVPQATTVDAMVEQAQDLRRQGQTQEATLLVEEALRLDPLHLGANQILISLAGRSDGRQELMARFEELARRHPNHASAQFLYARALMVGRRSGSETAAYHLQRALQLDPGFADAARMLSALRMSDGNVVEALRLARQAVDRDPGSSEAVEWYAQLLRAEGRLEEAIRAYENLALANPDDPAGWIHLWNFKLRADRTDTMRDRILAEISSREWVFRRTAEGLATLARFVERTLRDHERSVELWLEVAERFPDHPEAADALYNAARRQEPEDAIPTLRRLVELYPDSPLNLRAWHSLLERLIRVEEYDQAIAAARGLVEQSAAASRDAGSAAAGLGGARAPAGPGPVSPEDGAATLEPRDEPSATSWAETLGGIGHVGWYEAAQARAGAPDRGGFVRDAEGTVFLVRDGQAVRTSITRDRNAVLFPDLYGGPSLPVSPDAVSAARALRESGLDDSRALEWIGRGLLSSSSERALGLELMLQALDVARGPGGESGSGRERDEDVDRRLVTILTDLPFELARAGRAMDAAERADQLLVLLEGSDGRRNRRMRTPRAYYSAGVAYEVAGRFADAARQYHRALSSRSRGDAGVETRLAEVYPRVETFRLRQFAADRAPFFPLEVLQDRSEGRPGLQGQGLAPGGLTLVTVWAPWSGGSREALAGWVDLYYRYRDRGIGILSVVAQTSSRNLRRFARDELIPFPLATTSLERIEAAGIQVLPTTLLVDADGRVRARQAGFGGDLDRWVREWDAAIEAVLADSSR